MSWASENPEAYAEIERRGVTHWLRNKDGNEPDDYTLLMIQECAPSAWDVLARLAGLDIGEALFDHLSQGA